MHCIQVPNVTLWSGAPCLLYNKHVDRDGQCWLCMILQLSSKDIPYLLNWRQICSLRLCRSNCSSNFCRRRSTMPECLSVEPCGLPELNLLEAAPILDHCSKQSCTVDTFRRSLSAISWKENPPSRNPITRPRPNSVSGR
ncbi:hypothetical protein TNCV_2702211 [Trichonephila clavipes]|nr:hypothetical protein TNCV_2702211 [Trichonephila clavipes]